MAELIAHLVAKRDIGERGEEGIPVIYPRVIVCHKRDNELIVRVGPER